MLLNGETEVQPASAPAGTESMWPRPPPLDAQVAASAPGPRPDPMSHRSCSGPTAAPVRSGLLSPRPKHELAREHLDRGLAGVTAGDAAEAVAWLFLSLEATIVSVADKYGLDTMKQHWRKEEVAKELHSRGVLPRDYSSLLRLLNEARKTATYEGDEPDLEDQSLEDLAAGVQAAVELAEQEAK